MTDGIGSSVTTTLNIEVFADVLAFKSDPISGVRARTGSDYTGFLADDIVGFDYSVTVVSGPTWLDVAADGALSGRPSVSDVGSNSWQVQVTDGSATDTATFTIYFFLLH